MKLTTIFFIFFLLINSLACNSTPKTEIATTTPLTVAAAADLTPAFEELGKLYEQTTGKKVVFSFGSTGLLSLQIENGAPMDLFAAANIEFIDKLEKQNLIVPGTKTLYARGRITIWTRTDAKIKVERLEDLTNPEIKRIAIANPGHAPYGIAAQEAFQSLKILDKVQPKLVFGDNVRQTLQYAETGNVDVAIVALSLSVQSKGHWKLIPEELHKPIDQALAVIKTTKLEQDAKQFADFINGEQGRPIMRKYGFILPNEVPTTDNSN